MTAHADRAALRLVKIALTVVGAWYLNELIGRLPLNMPYAVDIFIRGALRLVGHSELAKPDDMEVLGWLLYFVVSLLFAGALVWLGNWVIRGYVSRHAHANGRDE